MTVRTTPRRGSSPRRTRPDRPSTSSRFPWQRAETSANRWSRGSRYKRPNWPPIRSFVGAAFMAARQAGVGHLGLGSPLSDGQDSCAKRSTFRRSWNSMLAGIALVDWRHRAGRARRSEIDAPASSRMKTAWRRSHILGHPRRYPHIDHNLSTYPDLSVRTPRGRTSLHPLRDRRPGGAVAFLAMLSTESPPCRRMALSSQLLTIRVEPGCPVGGAVRQGM